MWILQNHLKDKNMKSVYLVWKISELQYCNGETTTDLEAIYLTEDEAKKYVEALIISDNLRAVTYRKYEIEQRGIDRWEEEHLPLMQDILKDNSK